VVEPSILRQAGFMRSKFLILVAILLLTSTHVTFAQASSAIIDEYPVVSHLTNDSSRYIDELNDLIAQLIQDGSHRDYPGLFLAEDWNRHLWFKGFEVSTLASTMPYLLGDNRAALKTFLKVEVQNFLLNDAYRSYESNDEGTTDPKFPGAGFLRWWHWRSIEGETLYGLWAYAQYTNDWTLILNNWAEIRAIKDNISSSGYSKKIIAGAAGGIHEQALNSYISGKIAYGRMAKKLHAMTNQATYNQEYQQMIAQLPANLSEINTIIGCGYLECQLGFNEPVASCLANIAQLDFLTPSLARWYAENQLSGIQTVIDEAETLDPWWFMGSYNIMPGAHTIGNDDQGDFGAGCGEGYFESPLYAYQIFQGKARILQNTSQELISKLPVATTSRTIPIYWDMLNYANLTALIERIEGTDWVDSNSQPPTLTADLINPDDGLSTTDNTPTFSWGPVTNAVSYELQLDTSNPPNITVVSQTGRAFTPSASLLVATYYWRVRALDALGNPTPWSSIRSLHITSPANAAPFPSLYTDSAITLAWGRISWAAEYELQVDDSSSFALPLRYSEFIPFGTLEATTSLPDGTYYWRVRAWNSNGNAGKWSAVQSFRIAAG
jgi:hypothetical protein